MPCRLTRTRSGPPACVERDSRRRPPACSGSTCSSSRGRLLYAGYSSARIRPLSSLGRWSPLKSCMLPAAEQSGGRSVGTGQRTGTGTAQRTDTGTDQRTGTGTGQRTGAGVGPVQSYCQECQVTFLADIDRYWIHQFLVHRTPDVKYHADWNCINSVLRLPVHLTVSD